ncbi:UV-endonuclease UvdE [Richelia sinica FACHB-800]|uniref:UV-endonuclease UvdE n=1 Tax=Richelia sinica FACHB-800 TaxID=1357546 RepID=A0A975TCP1_9NOST|nr:hypothetical protein [Richelia sinica FACHB-800]QXE26015.1 UV-endonuclease UvdE [Richelia sinica FACHB-800]
MTITPLAPLKQQHQPNTIPHLGLVCITFDQQVRFKTMTRTRYLKLSLSERENALRGLYRLNLDSLHKALSFCAQNQIGLYRMSSALFPLSDMDDGIGANILEEMSNDLAQIGRKASDLNIRHLRKQGNPYHDCF